ncbi:photosystem I reaction center protein subunit XI [Leptolyngbya sp. 'hensonii']|uniref:photosystem I reaction center subunit XI n=1 Tax=Leptolyngbya sp. 'hensonii' TaxID=1922337 RepID=UPI00094FCB6F|nr:photosystem I reaction center subunit XI [Leptolyngbya sp. 'hensonii']OLP17322.1 photosystem I reaction center protein subunit XI [Leptolyngbya sp. 'hensonii']
MTSTTPLAGNLATPINSSPFSKAFINNLPAYRRGLSPFRRALEIGMAHGYLVYGPFATLGPLRGSDVGGLAGLLAASGLVVLLTIALSIYASSYPSSSADASDPMKTAEGWNEFAGGFLIGGIGGAAIAHALMVNLGVLSGIASSLS